MIWTIINAFTVNLERSPRRKANRLKWLPARTWEITPSFFNNPLLLPAPFLITRSFYPLLFLITRSFYPRPAPFTRSPLQIDTPVSEYHDRLNQQYSWLANPLRTKIHLKWQPILLVPASFFNFFCWNNINMAVASSCKVKNYHYFQLLNYADTIWDDKNHLRF
jgi:hypothetical protein